MQAVLIVEDSSLLRRSPFKFFQQEIRYCVLAVQNDVRPSLLVVRSAMYIDVSAQVQHQLTQKYRDDQL